ncbi:hypothetical protein T03_13294 [Trichinella britovi]|uniref:Uncharacterized protein n=1 Tax=Trichinella britovi TaxID=45882 RepID=A0A0V1DFN1_TRIBR|nr:hypothetical protein T03_13294 [Trichinella britovi]
MCEVNCVPLSETIMSGSPLILKICLKHDITDSDVVFFSNLSSSHLLKASTTIKKFLPKMGPARSTCMRDHGILGDSYLCTGACGGEALDCWHSSHVLTKFSISLSNFGHQT